MKRPGLTWLLFGGFLLVVLGVTGWTSWMAIRLDQGEKEARRQASLEERVRLSLWRMETALAPLIAEESARPYFVYRSLYAASTAYNRMFAELSYGEVQIPSPILQAPPFVLLHFQVAPDGTITSPQVPEGNSRDLAEAYLVGVDSLERSELG